MTKPMSDRGVLLGRLVEAMTAELVWQAGSNVPDAFVEWIDLDKLAEAIIPVIVDVYGPDF